MENDEFVYITHIRTTAEELWAGLTDPSVTERYWGLSFESDWAIGASMRWKGQGLGAADPEQKVLEIDPLHRLAYTWHTFTPEWAEVVGVDTDLLNRISAEPRSRVAFDIEPAGDVVKLTVVHSGFEPGSTVLGMLREGWPALLSSLKSLLETGRPLTEPVA